MKNDQRIRNEIHDTWNELAKTYRLIGRLWNKELQEYGFSREQALNLLIIKILGKNATPYKISRFQVQEHNTVCDILNRMQRQGLITKIRESEGKSRVKVRLTENGEKAYIQSLKRDVLIRAMSVLSEEELKNLRSLLEKIRDAGLVEYGEEGEWQQIRIPPSQWDKLDTLNKPVKRRSNKRIQMSTE